MNASNHTPGASEDPRWDDLVKNFQQLDAQAPREPSAQERADQLKKLFNTGPGAVSGPRDYVPEESDEPFVPDEPAALGSGDPKLNLAWTAAAGGPIGLLLCVLFFRSAPAFVVIGLALATIAGIAYLVKRLPTQRDPGDDGAQV
ncbi:hypothetical protein [Arthrobacter sp. NIO-1057]|uniref:hypothetical protein n=1 Tax=Arthrobacter sp. NIO-1057 TaxID=993071 RepID=UPI00071C8459|nr:hypothetical protein [Arthrobacter sp. NIO-1057]KSU64755.1 hypothetical protein AS038_15545 [Arthrobacter sp. NIO-1057]SCC51003.1 hypothetical protein GA0061084_3176 [Arthrobacter sp. NIO-1057]